MYQSYSYILFYSLSQFPILFLGETTISQDKKDQLNEAFGYLDGFLAKTKWVAGDNFTVADNAILASVSSIQVKFSYLT